MSYLLDSEKPISENSGGLGCNQVDTRLDQARHTHVVQLLFPLHDGARLGSIIVPVYKCTCYMEVHVNSPIPTGTQFHWRVITSMLFSENRTKLNCKLSVSCEFHTVLDAIPVGTHNRFGARGHCSTT